MTGPESDSEASIFLPDFASMSIPEVLDYIDRTRRQLDRFESLPGAAGKPIDPAEAATIRRLCDELEASLRNRS